jgi:hypothetical protein
MTSLSRIFFIYTEASLAVLLLILSLVEVLCYFALPDTLLSKLALIAAITFFVIAALNVLYIVHQERKYSH